MLWSSSKHTEEEVTMGEQGKEEGVVTLGSYIQNPPAVLKKVGGSRSTTPKRGRWRDPSLSRPGCTSLCLGLEVLP